MIIKTKTNKNMMNKLLCSLILAPLMYSGIAQSNPDITPQVVGGSESQPYSRPYQVALLMNGRQGCGGTLISNNWVLTAAHCLDNASTNSLTVKVGSHSLSQNDGQQIAVSQIITHEYWQGANGIRSGYDIGLLRLSSPASGEYTPAKLPTAAIEQSYASVGQNVTVSGWGLTSNQGSPSDRLREVDLPVISNQTCSSELNFNIPASVICGGGTGGVSACNGDSGGPYAVQANGQYYSIGTVSWGQACRGATAFTRTSSYLDWIKQKTGIGTDNPIDDMPTANFSYDINGTVVAFSNISSDDNGISSYNWNFGDGQSSSEQHPSHSYAVGSYNVTLTVTDTASQTNTASKVVTIADDTTTPGCDGITEWSPAVSYSLSEEVSYQGTKYEAIWWSTGASPAIYTNVWLDKGACSGDSDNLSPKAGFNVSVTGLTVNFTNTSTDDYGIISASWTFGDGASSTNMNRNHTFEVAGEYTVTLTVVDAEGLTAQVAERVIVSDSDGGDGCSGFKAWHATTVYLKGDTVTLNNQIYTANWWVQGDTPDSSGPWGPWTLTGQCN
jgi:PKD repeat protein